MYKICLLLVVASVLVQDIESCCCVSREPYMTKTCLECLYDLCPGYVPPCGCGCFKDISNPLGSCGCQKARALYFPEVEYPVTSINVNPFYYGSCFC